MLFFAVAATASLLASPAAPTVEDLDGLQIMKRVASTMESTVDARRQYVYKQKINARLVRTNGQVARAEKRHYNVAPGPEKTEKSLVTLEGEYHKSKKEIIRYTEPGFEKGGMDIDGGIMEDLIEDLVDDKDSRDGIPHSFFPLRTKDLSAFHFTYKDTIEVKGRKAYRVAFQPASKENRCSEGGDCSWRPWKGEAIIDAEDYQPVRIYSDLDVKMPWGVKVFLGTNLRQTGFWRRFVPRKTLTPQGILKSRSE